MKTKTYDRFFTTTKTALSHAFQIILVYGVMNICLALAMLISGGPESTFAKTVIEHATTVNISMVVSSVIIVYTRLIYKNVSIKLAEYNIQPRDKIWAAFGTVIVLKLPNDMSRFDHLKKIESWLEENSTHISRLCSNEKAGTVDAVIFSSKNEAALFKLSLDENLIEGTTDNV